jgi:hypothetical protein
MIAAASAAGDRADPKPRVYAENMKGHGALPLFGQLDTVSVFRSTRPCSESNVSDVGAHIDASSQTR